MIGVGRGPEPAPRSSPPQAGAVSAESAAGRAYWLALAQIPGVGPVTFARLVARYGSARAAWVAGPQWLDELTHKGGESTETYHSLQREGVLAAATRVAAALERVEGRAITLLDAAYPSALRPMRAPPPVLFVRGSLASLEAPTVAVVGTRRATGYGLSAAREIADELARAGATVASGLALGIDAAAHLGALEAGGPTIAVLPSPVDRIYPPRHGELASRIVAGGGALLSEVAPGQRVGKPDFARRNRVMAGLSVAVVVVEAPDRSGALLTAAAAVQLERELFAVPGPMSAVASRGTNRLIADHDAALVTSPVGLLQRIGLRRGGVPISVSQLSDAEAVVMAKLLDRPGSLEELIDRTGHVAATTASALTLLEARGLVTSYGGVTFHPTLDARRLGGRRGAP